MFRDGLAHFVTNMDAGATEVEADPPVVASAPVPAVTDRTVIVLEL